MFSKLGSGVVLCAVMGLGAAAAGGFGHSPAVRTNADDLAKVRAWVDASFGPFIKDQAALKKELEAANKERAGWKDYTEDYKSWTKEQAEANNPGYGYCEYVWSVKKDKEFRNKHMTTDAAKALKDFQDKSGGVIGEFFVTDAKGGNVVQTAATSDWFQGDEAKFKDCADKKAVAYGTPKRDDTTGDTGVHVSVPVMDANNNCIGVAIALVIVDKVK